MVGGAIAALTVREDWQLCAKETGRRRTRQELRVGDRKLIAIHHTGQRLPRHGPNVAAECRSSSKAGVSRYSELGALPDARGR